MSKDLSQSATRYFSSQRRSWIKNKDLISLTSFALSSHRILLFLVTYKSQFFCNVLLRWDCKHCTCSKTYERVREAPCHICNLLWQWHCQNCTCIERYEPKCITLLSERRSYFIDFIGCFLTPFSHDLNICTLQFSLKCIVAMRFFALYLYENVWVYLRDPVKPCSLLWRWDCQYTPYFAWPRYWKFDFSL